MAPEINDKRSAAQGMCLVSLYFNISFTRYFTLGNFQNPATFSWSFVMLPVNLPLWYTVSTALTDRTDNVSSLLFLSRFDRYESETLVSKHSSTQSLSLTSSLKLVSSIYHCSS